MKVFERGSKINFVDINNILVGYDMHQNCCENADWFISSERLVATKLDKCAHQYKDTELEEYVFDPDFIEDGCDAHIFECGGFVRFRLHAENKPDLYLHLINSHNGYYSHGFSMARPGRHTLSGNI